MKPSAVLLIDLENFYCSREDYCRNGPPPGYDRGRFSYDLDKLLTYARSMTADRATNVELPFTVKRAYADFNAAKYPAGAPPQYYLRPLPDELLSQGVEPVQVFRLSRGGGGRGSKNAADMRMAMDATALLASAGHVEHFVLVTGDADFIPVILELKRHGHTVSVIGVTGATSPKIQRFVDNFELFEDLLAAEEVEARSGEFTLAGDAFGQVAAAIRRLLARSHPLRFAAVKPLLSKELGHPFDPGQFGCDSTGEFLRANYTALGVVIRQGQHDSEIDLPGSVPNGNNGTSGSRTTSRPAARAQDRSEKPEKPPEKAAERPSKQSAPEPHTAAHYRQLLASPRGGAADREGKVHPIPWAALVWTCDAVVPLLTPPTGEPTHTTRLLPKLTAATEGAAIPDLLKHVRLFYPTLRAGLPAQGADGVYSLAEGTTGDQIRYSVLGYIAFVLKFRLADGAVPGDVRPDQLAAVFEPGPALDDAAAEFAAALTEPAPEPEPAAEPKPAPKPDAEEVHTATSYVKLLKAGGAKGSDTESFKVLPVPWPSVVRICDDAYRFLALAVGGGPLPRDQFVARLLDAGKELYVEKYDQHVRRVLGIFRLSCDVNEVDGLMTLSEDVESGHSLRARVLGFLLELLQLRLEEREVFDPIRPQVFVAALEAGPLTDQLVEETAQAVAWLYQPDRYDQPPAVAAPEVIAEPIAEPVAEPVGEAVAEPPPEPVPADAATADALDVRPEPAAPGVDSDVVRVGFESGAFDSMNVEFHPAPEPVVAEPAPPKTVPEWDDYTFDGVLPDTGPKSTPPETRQEAEQPGPSARAEPDAVFRLTECEILVPIASNEVAPRSSDSGPVEITSEEAAFALAEEAPPLPEKPPEPPAPVAEPIAKAPAEPPPAAELPATAPFEPQPEPATVMPPPPVPEPPPPPPVRPAPVFIGSRPLPDFLPDGDPIYPVASTDQPLILPDAETAPLTSRRGPPTPRPRSTEVDKMKPPPLPRRVVPPPLPPPPPPESA